MKTAAILIITLFIATTAFAGYVKGYTRSDGTYVQGYQRSAPDNSYNNNYSTQGNLNPNTGTMGTQRRTWNDNTPQQNQNTYGDPGYQPDYNSNSKNSYYNY